MVAELVIIRWVERVGIGKEAPESSRGRDWLGLGLGLGLGFSGILWDGPPSLLLSLSLFEAERKAGERNSKTTRAHVTTNHAC